MSQENIEILRRGFEAFHAGDLDRMVSVVAPEVEYCTSREDPDAATHRGRAAYKRYVEQWMESFEGLHADVEEYIDAGDGRVFTWIRWTGRGRTGGVDADWHLAIVYTVRDGQIIRGEEYFDRSEALEAAGLGEPA
jgi:ketosteroid isomerase-like protein